MTSGKFERRFGERRCASFGSTNVSCRLWFSGFAVNVPDFANVTCGSFGLVRIGEHDAVPLPAVGGNVLDVQNQIRKVFVENARLYFERDLFQCQSAIVNCRECAAVRGAIQMSGARLTAQASPARSITGRSRRFMEMPAARNAMASLSEDILPNPVKMPTRTAIGMVKVKTLGIIANESSPISRRVADWRTMISSSRPSCREKKTNVSATSQSGSASGSPERCNDRESSSFRRINLP